MKTSCTSDVAIVGSMGILDDTGAPAWEACGIPNYTAATVGSVAANAKLMYPMTPIPADQQTIGGFHLLFDQNPTWKTAVGSLYSNGAAGDREQHTYNEAIESLGAKIVYTAEYTPTTTNWAPYVTAMKSAGVKFLFLNDTDTTQCRDRAGDGDGRLVPRDPDLAVAAVHVEHADPGRSDLEELLRLHPDHAVRGGVVRSRPCRPT